MESVETNINGLLIRINKVVKDDKGFLVEVAPSPASDEFLSAGIKNIYASVAAEKYTARGGHFHNENIENFFTLSGTALWLFIDCRKDSPTFNNFYMVVLGSKKPTVDTDMPHYTIDDSRMAQALVPTGIYHIYWPLTDENVIVLAIASEPYNKDDYNKIDLDDYPKIKERLIKFGIEV